MYLIEKYLLDDPKNYTFVTGGALTIPSQDDVEEFQSTLEAMHIMGLNEDEITSIWRVIRYVFT